MNNSIYTNKRRAEQLYFLSELLGAKVILGGKKIGKLADVLIVEDGRIPLVTHFYVTRPFGNPALLVPWEKVRSITNKEIVIDIESLEKYEADLGKDALLLKDYVLDKKVLDMEGREVDVVYDVKMVVIDNKLYVSDVDFSRYGLLRRMGLKWLADFIYNLAARIKSETVSWAYIQPLPAQLSSFKGDIKLNILKEKLSEMHPVDLADIIEGLDQEQRAIIFDKLDTELASDALEEIDPSVQRAILASLSKEKIAKLVNEMTPGQAADVLAVLPSSDMRAILKLLDTETGRKIEAILEKHEEKILNYATSRFLKFAPDTTVRQARQRYGRTAKSSDVIMYLYVVDEQDKLLGVIDIRELMKASDDALLRDIMVDVVASLKPTSTLREASAMFTRYGFRAIPIINDTGKILGVVPYRDMMNLKHRFLE